MKRVSPQSPKLTCIPFKKYIMKKCSHIVKIFKILIKILSRIHFPRNSSQEKFSEEKFLWEKFPEEKFLWENFSGEKFLAEKFSQEKQLKGKFICQAKREKCIVSICPTNLYNRTLFWQCTHHHNIYLSCWPAMHPSAAVFYAV